MHQSIKRYDQYHSCGAFSTDNAMTTVCASPISAQKRVASPITKKAPSAASTSRTIQPKKVKFGNTNRSISQANGGNTGAETA